MSDKEKIFHRVSGLRRTKRWQVVLDYFVRGLFWGAIPAGLTIFSSRVWTLPFSEYIGAAAVLAAVVLGFLVAAAFVKITPLSVANDIDVSLGLRERISSAMSLGSSKQRKDPFVKTLVKDAAEVVQSLPLKKVYPWQLPRAWRLALPALLIAAALSFVPQLNWFINAEDTAQAELVQAEGNKLLELAKKVEEEAKEKEDPVLKKQAEEIKRVGEKLNNRKMKKKEALKELQRLQEKLEQQALTQVPQGETKLMAELSKELMKFGATRELGELLEAGNLQKMMQKMDQLMSDLAQGKLSPMQKQTLEDLLKALEESLKSDAAKDPDAQALKKAMEDLRLSLQKDQQLTQQLQDALNAFEKDMNELTKQLSQNNMGQQAQQLQQQLNQLKQQMQQNGSMSQKSLEQMLQALKNNQQAIQNNSKLSPKQKESLSQCNSQAQSHLQSPNGKPGSMSEANSQAQQNRQKMGQQMKDQNNCMGGT